MKLHLPRVGDIWIRQNHKLYDVITNISSYSCKYKFEEDHKSWADCYLNKIYGRFIGRLKYKLHKRN